LKSAGGAEMAAIAAAEAGFGLSRISLFGRN
jgi:hypothetical protein